MVEVSELRCPQARSWVGPSEAVKVIEEDFFTGSVFVTDDSFVVGEGRVFRQRLSCSFRRHAMDAHGGRGKFLTRSSSGTAATGRLATEPFCDGRLVCLSQVAHSER